jgi:hypothetical protein
LRSEFDRRIIGLVKFELGSYEGRVEGAQNGVVPIDLQSKRRFLLNNADSMKRRKEEVMKAKE